MSEIPKIHRHKDGRMIFLYKENGVLHRVGNPAVIILGEKGNVLKIEYWQNGKKYRDPNEGPVIVNFYQNGNPKCLTYYGRNTHLVHIGWYPNGNIRIKTYRRIMPDGSKHPKKFYHEYFYSTGELEKIEYEKKKSGKHIFHRRNGPALIVYDKNKNIRTKEYWINGNKI